MQPSRVLLKTQIPDCILQWFKSIVLARAALRLRAAKDYPLRDSEHMWVSDSCRLEKHTLKPSQTSSRAREASEVSATTIGDKKRMQYRQPFLVYMQHPSGTTSALRATYSYNDHTHNVVAVGTRLHVSLYNMTALKTISPYSSKCCPANHAP